MNEKEILIFQYSPHNNSWFDATTRIGWYKRDPNAWIVKYYNSNEFRHVSFSKMQIYSNPQAIDFCAIYHKNAPLHNVKTLLLFDNVAYKIFFESGKTKAVFAKEIRVEQNILKYDKHTGDIITYYRDILRDTMQAEEDAFLSSQFDNIDIINDNSVLALFLKKELGGNKMTLPYPRIAPFGTNLSQMAALELALENRISIIEGPPGTGKTQTILNIISNLVINNKTIAVVSNNNSATENVYNKLKGRNLSFIAASLGNVENVNAFFENYDRKIPSLKSKFVDQKHLRELCVQLPQLFSIENEIKNLETEQAAIDLEYRHFLFNNPKYNPKDWLGRDKTPAAIMRVILRFSEKPRHSIFDTLKLRRLFKGIKQLRALSQEQVITALYGLYYQRRISTLETKMNDLQAYLGAGGFNGKVSEYVALSKQAFENYLYDKYYLLAKPRLEYDKHNYKQRFGAFINEYPIVLSSTYALTTCTPKGFLYDYLIIDEASQVNMASALLSMMLARNVVIVGDSKQLPQIDNSAIKERNKELLKRYKIDPAYSYYGNSILSSLQQLYKNKIPSKMLCEHYRCDPTIIGFCNEKFYDDKLIIYTKHNTENYSMKLIKTTAGNFARKNPYGSGCYNQREIDEIKKLLSKEQLQDVGIITPYAYQAELLQNAIGNDVLASTIHKFQGKENKTIIFSSTANDVNEFISNDNLINVAVSRAIEKFILVTSDKIAHSKCGVISDLVQYIEYHKEFAQTEKGVVTSVYDILYDDYQAELMAFRMTHPSKDYDTETITKVLIERIIAEMPSFCLGFSMHLPLLSFIHLQSSELTEEENQYYSNPLTHADFVLFHKMGRKPVLVIEVDGVSYHEQNIVQRERDKKKDSILQKAGIPLLRLKTNESDEYNRIKKTIVALMSAE